MNKKILLLGIVFLFFIFFINSVNAGLFNYTDNRTHYLNTSNNVIITDLLTIEGANYRTINGNTAVDGGDVCTLGGWDYAGGGSCNDIDYVTCPLYDSIGEPYSRSGLCISMDALSFDGLGLTSSIPAESGFNGSAFAIINFTDVDNGDTLWALRIYTSGNNMLFGIKDGNWGSNGGDCTLQPQNVAQEGVIYRPTIYWNSTTTATSYVNTVTGGALLPCDTFAGLGNLDDLRIAYSGGGAFWTVGYVGMTNGTEISPEQEAPPPPPQPILNVSLFLFNVTNNNTLNIDTDISEDTPFFIGANYTTNSTSSIFFNYDSSCLFNATNIAVHFVVRENNNFTINSATSKLKLDFSENNKTVLNDRYEFAVCRELIKADLQVYINETLIDTIDKNVIPLCSMGSHLESVETNINNGFNVFNFSLGCLDCNAVNTQLTVLNNQLDVNELIHYERKFERHIENMTKINDKLLYGYFNHEYKYSFSNALAGNITIKCNDTENNFLFPISDKPLIINILDINELGYTNGTNLQATKFYNITIDVFGDVINNISLNVTNSSGSLIKSTSLEFLSINNSELYENGLYLIKISATDDEDIISNLVGSFMVNDTVNPVITWTYPNDLNTSTGSNFTYRNLTIGAFDINLFAYNLTCFAPSGKIMLNKTLINIPSDTVNFTDTLFINESGIIICKLEITDSHTDEDIIDFDLKQTSNSLTFDNIKITGVNAINTNTIKLNDRYTLDFYYDSKIVTDKVYEIESNNTLYYIQNSKYTAHFVDYKNKRWIDFEGLNGKPIIKKISNTKYSITFKDNDNDLVSFNSIGVLNTVEEHRRITVPKDLPTEEEVPLTTPGVLNELNLIFLFLVLTIVELFFVYIAFKFNHGTLLIIAMLYGIIIDLAFINANVLNNTFTTSVVIKLFLELSIGVLSASMK